MDVEDDDAAPPLAPQPRRPAFDALALDDPYRKVLAAWWAAHEAWRAAFPTMELDDLKTEKPKAPRTPAGCKLPVVTPEHKAAHREATEALAAARAAHAVKKALRKKAVAKAYHGRRDWAEERRQRAARHDLKELEQRDEERERKAEEAIAAEAAARAEEEAAAAAAAQERAKGEWAQLCTVFESAGLGRLTDDEFRRRMLENAIVPVLHGPFPGRLGPSIRHSFAWWRAAHARKGGWPWLHRRLWRSKVRTGMVMGSTMAGKVTLQMDVTGAPPPARPPVFPRAQSETPTARLINLAHPDPPKTPEARAQPLQVLYYYSYKVV